MSGSASSSSYDPYALGMPSCAAVACALARSREAIAVISQSVPRCIAGSTFATPILAVLRTPQRILVMICSFAGYSAAPCYYTGRNRSPFCCYRCYYISGTFRAGVRIWYADWPEGSHLFLSRMYTEHGFLTLCRLFFARLGETQPTRTFACRSDSILCVSFFAPAGAKNDTQ